jgi:hypothetical protein
MADKKISVREHAVLKETRWGDVKKSLNQDFVFINDELAGYYLYIPRVFEALAGFEDVMGEPTCRAIEQIKQLPTGAVRFLAGPPIELPAPVQEDEDDE